MDSIKLPNLYKHALETPFASMRESALADERLIEFILDSLLSHLAHKILEFWDDI